MIKKIDDCSSFFGYGIIDRTIGAIVFEFYDIELSRCASKSRDKLSYVFSSIIEEFPDESCYLYIRFYGMSKTNIRLELIKKQKALGNFKLNLNNIVFVEANDRLMGVEIEFRISEIELVFQLMRMYPLSSIAVISDPNTSEKTKTVIEHYNEDSINDSINIGCIQNRAVFTLICGNDGNAFCCFYKKA